MPDLDAAIRFLRAHLSPHPDGHCALHVRQALDAAGFDTTGHPPAAKLYGPFLLHLGFAELPENESAVRLPGDVRVWQGPSGDPWGHVAMWSGGEHGAWDADFAMRSDLPGASFAGTPFATFRYPQAPGSVA